MRALLEPDDCWFRPYFLVDLRHIARGAPGSTALEGLLVRSAVDPAPRRASLPETLDLIRSACGADSCELFLLDGTDRVQDDDRFRRDAVKRRGIRTFIGVSVLEGGGPVGDLGAGWKHPSIPLAWGLQMLQAMQPVALDAARRAGPVDTVALTDCALRCFGPLEIMLGDRRLSQEAFDRRKSLDLLRHLLLAQDTPTPRDVLIEKLWPEAPPAAGTNRLHVALNSLRQTLAEVLPERTVSLVQQRHGHYRLNLAALGTVDAFLFSDGLDAARVRLRSGDRDCAVESLEQVLPLYRGDLFADADDVAFEIPRQRFRLRYREALRLLVDLYLRQGRLDAAISALTDAIDRTSSESELHEGLLHELVAQQRPAAW